MENVSSSCHGRRFLKVAVEGNIGSGKSTFLSYCQPIGGFDVMYEPVEQWRNVRGENLLVSIGCCCLGEEKGHTMNVFVVGEVLRRSSEMGDDISNGGQHHDARAVPATMFQANTFVRAFVVECQVTSVLCGVIPLSFLSVWRLLTASALKVLLPARDGG